MKKEAAEILADAGGKLRETYSGRGMYGKETSGVMFDDEREFFRAIAGLIEDYVTDGNEEDASLLCEALKKLQSDNIGRSIIYY